MSPSGLMDKKAIRQQEQQLESRFRGLATITYETMVRMKVDIDDFRARLTSLDVFRLSTHREFLDSHVMKVEQGTTFYDLWVNLNVYWNFLNFDLLEHIVNSFNIEDLKHKMVSYVHDLQSFRKATRVCDFVDCWPVLEQSPPKRSDLRKFIAKMKLEWDKCTLEDLETLKGVITHKFFLPGFALQLKKLKKGCITVTWTIPAPFVKPLLEAIQSTSSKFFMEQKIDKIAIDGQDCYPSPISRSSGYLKEQDTPEKAQTGVSPAAGKKLHPSKLPIKSEQRETKTALTTFESELSIDSPTQTSPLMERYVEQRCVDKVAMRTQLLPSVEQYLSHVEVEANPSLPTKYRDYLSSTPGIRAATYTPFIAKTLAEVFTWTQLTESPPPTTITELFTTFTLKTLVGYLSTHPLYRKQQLKVTGFSDLPPEVYKQFLGLCRMACKGILNHQQLVFSAAHFPTGFSPLGLMQEVPQVYTQGKASSYHFIHLTLQEFLSAVHVSQLPTDTQTELIQRLNSGHFKKTLRFVSGLTKLANIPPEITGKLRKNTDNVILFHWLFESTNTSVTTRTLGSNDMVVAPDYSWTPLDYYVTGHVLSHSNCCWKLHCGYSSINNDENFQLLCQGCAIPVGTECESCISDAVFSNNDMTSKHMQSFVNIPKRILQAMGELDLSVNKLDGSACDLLANVVPSMSQLKKLLLSSNPIGNGGAVEVIKSLCASGVRQLDLSNTGIGEPDCEALSKLLPSIHTLEWLHISQNNLSSESVASIINGLSCNNSLTTLVISNSHFSMGNMLLLSSLLRKCTLTSLVLQYCQISSEGAVELAAALCRNTTLRELDLGYNPIGEHEEGVAAIAAMLVENTSLTLLDLEDCHICGQGAGELAAALGKNSILQCLNLDHNPVGVEGALSMSDMLQHNTSLTILYMDDDSVGEDGVLHLMNSVKDNQTLEDLSLSSKYDHRIVWLDEEHEFCFSL